MSCATRYMAIPRMIRLNGMNAQNVTPHTSRQTASNVIGCTSRLDRCSSTGKREWQDNT